MLVWIERLLDLINKQLGANTVIAAIIVPLIISSSWTQWTKNLPVWHFLSDNQMKWATRLCAFLAGAAPSFILWPKHDASGAVMAIAVGLSSPTLYKIIMFFAKLKYPKVEGVMSARPYFELDDEDENKHE